MRKRRKYREDDPKAPRRSKWHRGKLRLLYRVMMEEKLGRPLRKDEVVHHINGNKHDNRPENLEVISDYEHRSLHQRQSTIGKLNELARGWRHDVSVDKVFNLWLQGKNRRQIMRILKVKDRFTISKRLMRCGVKQYERLSQYKERVCGQQY